MGKSIVVHIDELMRVCGYANAETNVNNHYGCDHSDCEETEIVKVLSDGSHKRLGEDIEYQVLKLSLRRKYGSWGDIKKESETEDFKHFVIDIRDKKIYDNEFLREFGLKRQGKCYSFSCPLANSCDLEDLKEHDSELYEEWRNEKYDPRDCGADLMLITDENLIKKLS